VAIKRDKYSILANETHNELTITFGPERKDI